MKRIIDICYISIIFLFICCFGNNKKDIILSEISETDKKYEDYKKAFNICQNEEENIFSSKIENEEDKLNPNFYKLDTVVYQNSLINSYVDYLNFSIERKRISSLNEFLNLKEWKSNFEMKVEDVYLALVNQRKREEERTGSIEPYFNPYEETRAWYMMGTRSNRRITESGSVGVDHKGSGVALNLKPIEKIDLEWNPPDPNNPPPPPVKYYFDRNNMEQRELIDIYNNLINENKEKINQAKTNYELFNVWCNNLINEKELLYNNTINELNNLID